MDGIKPVDFTGMPKSEILKSFGYEISQTGMQYKVCIKDDPEAFTLVGESESELVDEAYQFLMQEVDQDIGYVFPA